MTGISNRDAQKPGESLMLAGTRAEVRQLNRLARQELAKQGHLHSEITIETDAWREGICSW